MSLGWLVISEKRWEYWDHFVAEFFLSGRTLYGPDGGKLTGRRLARARVAIMNNDEFWSDIVLRHNGQARSPRVMLKEEPEIYEHCSGNFWGQVSTFVWPQR